MIENRAKIEKQILLGRQDVRKSLSGRTALPEPRSLLLEKASPNSRLDPLLPSLSLSPSQGGSENPLSVDTDAEAAFSIGSRWFFNRGHTHMSHTPTSGSATPQNGNLAQDPLQIPAIRKKWTSELLSPVLNPTPDSRRFVFPVYSFR